uniref:Fibulin-2 domain-containing protein n=2 Tax=Ciona intestinalis TaxID=7719 RepID=F7A9D2_CIOIN
MKLAVSFIVALNSLTLVSCFSYHSRLANARNQRLPNPRQIYENQESMLNRGRRGGVRDPTPFPAYPYGGSQPRQHIDSEPNQPYIPNTFNDQAQQSHSSSDSANVGNGAPIQPADSSSASVDSANTASEHSVPCDKTKCPPLRNCINETSSETNCCPTCDRSGCQCEGYQYYDCLLNGFVGGLVPEGESYSVDDGSTMCSCPMGGGMIVCSFQVSGFNSHGRTPPKVACPKPRPFCIETYTRPSDGCEECLAVGCVGEDGHKYQAGVNFDRPPCTVCYCPPEGGDILCATDHVCQERMDQRANPPQTSLALEATQRVMRDPIG